MLSMIWVLCTSTLWVDLFLYKFSSTKTKCVRIKSIGRKLVVLLSRLGPAFVKFGQTLATRSDLIGEDISVALRTLQDRMPPCGFHLMRPTIQASACTKLKINEVAIAAASIAQVYKGVTPDGETVAIKILRPDIAKKFANNLKLLGALAWLANCFSAAKRLRLLEIVAQLKCITDIELNLMMEAASADQLRENMRNDRNVKVPKIFWEYTTQDILVMEWIDGISIYSKDKIIAAGFQPSEIAKNLAAAFFNQAYRDGFFHADLHQGNVLIDQDGKVVFLDFGIMGHIDYKNRMFVAQILEGFIQRDYERVARLHFDAGYVPKGQSEAVFAIACRSIGEPILNKPVEEISISQLLQHLFSITKKFQMKTQPQLLLLQKTMVTVEGISLALDNKVNMWLLISPWIEEWAKDNLGVKKILHDIQHSSKAAIKQIKACLLLLEKYVDS